MSLSFCFVLLLQIFTSLKQSNAIINAEIAADTPTLNGVQYALTVSKRFPSMVEVLRNRLHLCGGALIRPNMVITAARCISMNSTVPHLGLYYLLTGNQIRNAETKPWYIQRRTITKVMLHPEWPTDEAADLALLRPSSPFELNDYTNVIKLHVPHYIGFLAGRIYGWGFTETHIYSKVLRTLEMDFQRKNKCAYLTNSTRHICLAKGDSSPCFGDFGAPLVGEGWSFTGTNNFLIGLISYVPGARMPGDPTKVNCFADKKAIAVKLKPFLDWIDASMTEFNLTMYN